jgi:hypothetical protein
MERRRNGNHSPQKKKKIDTKDSVGNEENGYEFLIPRK